MDESLDALIRDLLEWVGPAPRPYRDVMEAWRTSCPRLPVWEEANDRGFLARLHEPGQVAMVAVTPSGKAFLQGKIMTNTRPIGTSP